MEYGPPISVSPDLLEDFKKGGEFKRKAVQKLMDEIHDQIRELTLTAKDFDELMVINSLLPVTTIL